MKPDEVASKVEDECERLLVEYFFDPYFENMFADINVSKGSYCVNLSRAPNAFFPLRLDVDVVPAIQNPEGGEFILNMKEGVWFKSNHKLHLERWNKKLQQHPMIGRIIFMLKVWNSCNGNLRQGRKPMFKGIHFEALLLDWTPAPYQNEDEAMMDAISHIKSRFKEPFVAGGQQHACSYITEDPELLQCVEEKTKEAILHLSGICEILQGRQIKDLNLDETYEVSKKVALLCSQDLETHSKPVLFTSDFMLMEFAIDYFFGAGEGHIMSHFYTPELVKSWVDSLAEAGSLSDSMYYDLRTKDEWDALEAQKHALGLTKWKLLWIAGKTLGIDFLKKFASHRG
ncbi:unnamed protein product [Durusdinium trenchii]|uniref:Uncharacterized protein n=1 Tax=Durusdinium trenchii TaxID=1381693 RepID=A0ABP0NY86_9DINO